MPNAAGRCTSRSRARRVTSSRGLTSSNSWTARVRSRRSLSEMSAVRVRVEVAALQTLLTALGVLMALASRRVDRFRRQVTRDLLLEIRSDDGARQQFRLHVATRRLTLPRHPIGRAECTLIFPTARVGLRILISRRAIGRLVEDMNFGGTRIDGNPVLMLWFHGLTRIVAPIGSTRRARHHAPVPV